jgi:hypothetical protein
MNNSMNSRRNAARIERQQRKLDAGFVDALFQKSLSRVINFLPGSYALFRIECLNRECSEGGFDLSEVITGMIRNRRGSAKGSLSCEGKSPSANHSTIAYEVSIQYT